MVKSRILVVACVIVMIIIVVFITSPQPDGNSASSVPTAVTSNTSTTITQEPNGSATLSASTKARTTLTSTFSLADTQSTSESSSFDSSNANPTTSFGSSNTMSVVNQSSTGSSLRSIGGSGTLSIQLTDPPNVPANVTSVYINYSQIQVGILALDNSSISWYNATTTNGEINLMQVLNISITVGGNLLGAGTFSQIAFNISSALITYNGLNYSAVVQNGFINSSIISGGIYVPQGGSAGLLVDISPTVTAFQNDSGSYFLLNPAAIGIPIPSNYWNTNLERLGAIANFTSSAWWETSNDLIMGNITIQYAILSNFTLQVFVQNIGNNNVTINQVSVLENTTLPSNSTTMTSNQTVNSTTPTTNETQNQNLQYYLQTIGNFQVLSNSTLISPNLALSNSSLGPNVSVGVMVTPGQILTLNFNGNITQDSLGNNLYQITVGQTFEIAVLGDFGTSVYLISVQPITGQQD
ncbi:MAG: DUF4382 domain-containing protein [Thaumarchaeota archaeon]|nr:DUF4382 domain-containing protein [Nitrososphaerota archaeon]